MNITSMTGQELYKTLFGQDTQRQVTEEAKQAFLEANPPVNGKYDRLMIMTEENSEHIDPDTSSLQSLYDTGTNNIYKLEMFLKPKTDEELAKRFGEIGARLDTAYKEGKFTEDEYNELNAGLTELISVTKARNDKAKASREFAREHQPFEAIYNPEELTRLKNRTKEEEKAESDEWKAYRKAEIDKIIARIAETNPLESLLALVNNYRNANTENVIANALSGEFIEK
ncbi:MAG: hypothetical protein LBL98_05905 [Ruminococcus sp.]|jgi:hypothetical protein|nr:hypothetical protein [Ruminococcus sp.]